MKKMQIDTSPKQGNETPFQRFEQLAKKVVFASKKKEQKQANPQTQS
jgi:hypothetical protein